jgi:hypothetical protein
MKGRGRIGVVNDDIKHLLGPELKKRKRVQSEIRTPFTEYSDNSTEGHTRFYKRESRIEIQRLATSFELPRLRMH